MPINKSCYHHPLDPRTQRRSKGRRQMRWMKGRFREGKPVAFARYWKYRSTMTFWHAPRAFLCTNYETFSEIGKCFSPRPLPNFFFSWKREHHSPTGKACFLLKYYKAITWEEAISGFVCKVCGWCPRARARQWAPALSVISICFSLHECRELYVQPSISQYKIGPKYLINVLH